MSEHLEKLSEELKGIAYDAERLDDCDEIRDIVIDIRRIVFELRKISIEIRREVVT